MMLYQLQLYFVLIIASKFWYKVIQLIQQVMFETTRVQQDDSRNSGICTSVLFDRLSALKECLIMNACKTLLNDITAMPPCCV